MRSVADGLLYVDKLIDSALKIDLLYNHFRRQKIDSHGGNTHHQDKAKAQNHCDIVRRLVCESCIGVGGCGGAVAAGS
jgi:hypothetical protein